MVDGQAPKITICGVECRRAFGIRARGVGVAQREVQFRQSRPRPCLDVGESRDLRRANGAVEIHASFREVAARETQIAEPLAG